MIKLTDISAVKMCSFDHLCSEEDVLFYSRCYVHRCLRIKKWSIVPDQIRTNNSLLFAGTIAFCSQGRCGSYAEI